MAASLAHWDEVMTEREPDGHPSKLPHGAPLVLKIMAVPLGRCNRDVTIRLYKRYVL